MNIDHIRRKIAELDGKLGWYQNIDLKCGVSTKSRSLWGEDADHPRQRWTSIEPAFPASFAGKTVLDVGCNAGYFSFVAADRGAKRVVGVDYNEGYVEQARFCNAARGDSVEFHQGSVNNLAALKEKFDITLCIGLLYHVPDLVGAVRNIANVTREMVIVESAIHPGNNDKPLVLVASGTGSSPGSWHPNMTALKYMFTKVGFKVCRDVFVRGGRGGIVAYK